MQRLRAPAKKNYSCNNCCGSAGTEVQSPSKFSNKGTLSRNLSPRLVTAVRLLCLSGVARAGPGTMLTVCPATPQLHLPLRSNTHTHTLLIFTGPTTTLHLKLSGRDLYGRLRPPYNCECVCVCMSSQVPEGLLASLQTSLCAHRVSMRSVFTCTRVFRKCMCACLQGPPSRVLIGPALPSWVSEPSQAPSRLAAEGASQPV